MQPVKRDLDRFYAALRRLSSLAEQGVTLGSCTGRMPWPERGVYFFVEPGELRADGTAPRITRVGTHGVSSNSRSTLWQRLRAHRGALSGSGNHRGSVFRRHVGAAILQRGAGKLPVLQTWGVGSNAAASIRAREAALESMVTSYLAQTRVFWIEVPDAPGRESKRSFIERNAIALLSNDLCPADRPTANWLGGWADREEIRESGLWNVDYVRERHDSDFLRELEESVARMAAATSTPIHKRR